MVARRDDLSVGENVKTDLCASGRVPKSVQDTCTCYECTHIFGRVEVRVQREKMAQPYDLLDWHYRLQATKSTYRSTPIIDQVFALTKPTYST